VAPAQRGGCHPGVSWDQATAPPAQMGRGFGRSAARCRPAGTCPAFRQEHRTETTTDEDGDHEPSRHCMGRHPHAIAFPNGKHDTHRTSGPSVASERRLDHAWCRPRRRLEGRTPLGVLPEQRREVFSDATKVRWPHCEPLAHVN
jgi:hypothetical protein